MGNEVNSGFTTKPRQGFGLKSFGLKGIVFDPINSSGGSQDFWRYTALFCLRSFAK